MRRRPVTHGGVFTDEAFAREYARKHRKMAEGFGKTYGQKLKASGRHPGRILDAGCGFGGTLLALAEEIPDCDLVGVDLSTPLLDMAREEAEAGGMAHRIRFEEADVQDLPFEDESFDAVLSVNMAHLVDDAERMTGQLVRVLRPGGILYMADLRRSFLGLVEREIRSAFSTGEAREMIRASGLEGGDFSAGLLWWRFEWARAGASGQLQGGTS